MVQAAVRATTIRSGVGFTADPDVLYIPVIHSTRFGDYVADVALTAATKAKIADDIAHGQLQDVVRVIGVDLTAGTSWDATEEMAKEALGRALDDASGFELPSEIISFAETHLGCRYVAEAQREAA